MSSSSASTPLSKSELRSALRGRRSALPALERGRASAEITARLLDLVDWETVGSLHVYASVPAWGEVDTASLVATIAERWPWIEIVSPSHSRLQTLPDAAFDVIVVPVLGFDGDNFRLGLGGGFYDRLLAAQPQALKIGLAYAWALVPGGLPREAHDVPLDLVVTDADRR